jgi:hypothetical protein
MVFGELGGGLALLHYLIEASDESDVVTDFTNCQQSTSNVRRSAAAGIVTNSQTLIVAPNIASTPIT